MNNIIDKLLPLTIYKASAGSGKTFTLATEYIKLLIKNPLDYKNILAVTFTNKATEEMKMRILSQLYGIWKELPDSNVYAETICKDLGISHSKVISQAGIALNFLMHNYSYFKVETIDSFFQRIFRNISRELDININMRLELNDSQIEEKAVDEIIEELDENNNILQWIISYINEKISDDKSWNVIHHIKNFGKTIFNDYYKQESQSLALIIDGDNFFEKYITVLREDKETAQNYMQRIAQTFFSTLEEANLSIDDLSNKSSGVAGFFLHINNGIFDESIEKKRVIECLNSAEKWSTKTHPQKNYIHKVATDKLMPILKKAFEERPIQWNKYKSSDLTLRHLYQLRLLDIIEKKVREINERNNCFLLSDTQNLLKSLIGDDDSPFIFEKIGSYLKHIMIDEFQDTSYIQWENFKILLKECMSHKDTKNLIVGDVKQSIYRWRSGDWELLNSIESQFERPNEQLKIETLQTNYRSQKNIILFNNTFFSKAIEIECDKIYDSNYSTLLKQAYADVCQTIPDKRQDKGYININLLPKENYQYCVLEEIRNSLHKLIDNGISPNSITILVRNNKYIPIIAEYFTKNEPEFNIVSDEAFRLSASLSINILILSLRLLIKPNDRITKLALMKAYLSSQNNDYDECYFIHEDSENILPYEFTNEIASLQEMPLYELVERLLDIFKLKEIKGQSAYICAFYDYLDTFISNNVPCIANFLEEWDSNTCNKTIQSDSFEGIRIISIHKSKGLEYNNVIIPFCDWQITQRDILWCKPNISPYNKLPIAPIDYSKSMIGTIYERDYHHEYLQNTVDNLNLLYVAFTRARDNLFVIGKRDTTNSRSNLIQLCLPHIAKELQTNFIKEENKSIPIEFEYGSICEEKSNKEKISSNVFLKKPEVIKIQLKTFKEKIEFRQSNKSRTFIGNDDIDSAKMEYINAGNVLHHIFSKIHTTEDIEIALENLEIDGILNSFTKSDIRKMLNERLENKKIADWFSGKWDLHNECAILYKDKTNGSVQIRRPDRVMTDGNKMIIVDFKFGTPREEYKQQLQEYMNLATNMGYKRIEGYLWFVYSNKIEKL